MSFRDQPDPLRNLFDTLKSRATDFATEVSTETATVAEESHTGSIARFAIKKWDDIPGLLAGERWTLSGRMILLEIKLEERGLGAYLYIGPSSSPTRAEFLGSLLAQRLIAKSATLGKG